MTGHTKNGYTSHMLLSFPTDASLQQVKCVALDWADHFFNSGEYGDRWDYLLAIHTDRDHPHAHILDNNRGKDSQTFLTCWKEGIFSPQLTREKQADFAEAYSLHLDASTRLERGIFALSPSVDEIYRAKAEGRAPVEEPMAPKALAFAKGQAKVLAKEYSSTADLLRRSDKHLLARAVGALATSLQEGRAHDATPFRTIEMSDTITIRQAVERASNTIRMLFDHRETLDPIKRVEFEAEAGETLGGLSHFTPHDDRATPYRYQAAVYPAALSADEISILTSPEDVARFAVIDADARAIGLNPAVLKARIAQQSNNFGVLEDWRNQDMEAIMAHAREKGTEELVDRNIALRDTLIDQYAIKARIAVKEFLGELKPDYLQSLVEGFPYDRSQSIAATQNRNPHDDRVFISDITQSLPALAYATYQDRIADEGVAAFEAWENPALVARRFMEIEADAGHSYPRLQQDLEARQTLSSVRKNLAPLTHSPNDGAEAVRIADQLNTSNLTKQDEQRLTRELHTRLHSIVGDEGMPLIRSGQTYLLQNAIPSAEQRAHVVAEYLEHSTVLERNPDLAKPVEELRRDLQRGEDELEL